MFDWSRPVSVVNARVVTPQGIANSIRFSSRVLSIDGSPSKGDLVVDAGNGFVLPGLVNAHDHLELNHYGFLRPRDRYANATEWIDDLRPLLSTRPDIRRNSAFDLAARLLSGVIKNVLSGATTVAHHNPRYRELGRIPFVRVIERYGWAHSFALEHQPVGAHGEPGGDVRQRYLSTPPDVPFILHLGEGCDRVAASELAQFESRGCLRENAVLVHGVALTPEDWSRVRSAGAALVWCPASNMGLFGKTAAVRHFLDVSVNTRDHICIGTDSRLTGSRDLLDELRVARDAQPVTPDELLTMVTAAAADVLRLPTAGRLRVGVPADLVVLPPLAPRPAEALLAASRNDLSLVVVGGKPVVGSPLLGDVFAARRVATRPILVDGATRIADTRFVAAIASSPIRESGLSLAATARSCA